MLLFTLTWLAQGYSLLISDALVSPMAPENMHAAVFSAGLEQDLLLAFGVLACRFTVVLCWRGSRGWMEHGGAGWQ